MKNKWKPFLFVLSLFLAVVSCNKKENSNASDSSSHSKAQAVSNPDFTTDARSLYSELRANIAEDGLDIKPEIKQKYANKNVRLSGKIKKNIEMLGSREVTMEGDDNLGQVFLKFNPQSKAKSESLTAGDEIVIQCVGVSWKIGPQLEKCVFIP